MLRQFHSMCGCKVVSNFGFLQEGKIPSIFDNFSICAILLTVCDVGSNFGHAYDVLNYISFDIPLSAYQFFLVVFWHNFNKFNKNKQRPQESANFLPASSTHNRITYYYQYLIHSKYFIFKQRKTSTKELSIKKEF